MKRTDRVGEQSINKLGESMSIIAYRGALDIDIQFKDGGIVSNTRYSDFLKGSIKNPYYKSVFGVGYIANGRYTSRVNGKKTKYYTFWKGIIERCYNKSYQTKRPTYKGCTVCEEWHNFQNFGRWYDENYYEIEDKKMCLDKDILKKGNKIYSPETCVIVPDDINLLFIKNNANRGDLPIGVIQYKASKKYLAQCGISKNTHHRNKYLGLFTNIEDAFIAYKNFKEYFIKKIADEYKNVIPEILYEAMYKYIVEITD